MYRKSIRATRKERKRERALAMVEARRRRMAEGPGADWQVFEHVLRYAVAPDGRTVALAVGKAWRRTGSERTIRGILARAIYGHARRIEAGCAK